MLKTLLQNFVFIYISYSITIHTVVTLMRTWLNKFRGGGGGGGGNLTHIELKLDLDLEN